jgi:hypothetical protein
VEEEEELPLYKRASYCVSVGMQPCTEISMSFNDTARPLIERRASREKEEQ